MEQEQEKYDGENIEENKLFGSILDQLGELETAEIKEEDKEPEETEEEEKKPKEKPKRTRRPSPRKKRTSKRKTNYQVYEKIETFQQEIRDYIDSLQETQNQQTEVINNLRITLKEQEGGNTFEFEELHDLKGEIKELLLSHVENIEHTLEKTLASNPHQQLSTDDLTELVEKEIITIFLSKYDRNYSKSRSELKTTYFDTGYRETRLGDRVAQNLAEKDQIITKPMYARIIENLKSKGFVWRGKKGAYPTGLNSRFLISPKVLKENRDFVYTLEPFTKMAENEKKEKFETMISYLTELVKDLVSSKYLQRYQNDRVENLL